MFPFRLHWLRWILYFMGGLACIFGAGLFFSKSSGLNQWVPATTALVLKVSAFEQFTDTESFSNNAAWAAFFQSGLARQFKSDAALLLKITEGDTNLTTQIRKAKALLACTLQAADDQHGLFVLECSQAPILTKVLSQPTLRSFPSQFNGYTLYTIYSGKNQQLVLVRVKNYLICAHFSYLIEDALTQYEARVHWWDARKYEAALPESAPWKILMRPAYLNAVLSSRLQKQWTILPEMVAQNLNWVGIAWDGVQMYAAGEGLGALRALDRWGKPASSKMFKIIPDHTACWGQLSFDQRSVFWDPFTHGSDAAFRRYILPWVGTELACVLTEPLSPGMLEDQFLVIETRDQEKVRACLNAYGAERGTLKIENYQMFEVYSFLDQAILEPITGQSRTFRNPVCAAIGDYVVFAGSRSAIEVWIDKYIVNQTLANHTGFLQLYAGLGAQGNGFVYLNTGYIKTMLNQLLEVPLAPETPEFTWEKAGLVGIQAFPGGKNRIDFKVMVQSTQEPQAETGIVWKTPLSAPARTQPFLCTPETGQAAVLIQDIRHELYCLGINGATKWRRQLTEPILSKVYALDFFDNSRTCYLFNTATAIWMLDENGQTVDGFPIRLQSAATNGLCLVDFDQNHHYSMFLACNNGNIYGFDQYGRPLSGWNPLPAKGRFLSPILHFQQAHQDYLVALNTEGKLWALGRNGTLHFPVLALQGQFLNPPQLSKSGSENRQIMCFNTKGTAFQVSLNGTVRQFQTGTPVGNSVGVTNPGSSQLAILNGKQLYFGDSGKGFKSAPVPVAFDTLFSTENGSYGGLQRNTAKIILLKPAANFSLAGTTPFVIYTQAESKLLITGNGASVYAYKLKE